MNTLIPGATALLTLLLGIACPAVANEEPQRISEMIAGGQTTLSFRYRYEFVDQAGIEKEAKASTLKSRLSWDSALYRGLSIGIEVDNVAVIGEEKYRTPGNGETTYPVVADPEGTDLNQAFLRYSGARTKGTFGRQRILHLGQRFLGSVAWRQNEQTYDALRIEAAKLGPVTADYAYIWDVNRIFGPDNSPSQASQWSSDSHVLLLSIAPATDHTLTLFTYLLDFDNAPGSSNSTVGIDYSGRIGALALAVSLATQSDYGSNSASYDADYAQFELGTTFKPVSLAVGYELMGSDNGSYAFQTPLATLHKFAGWADKFLNTPVSGLEDVYFKASGKAGPVDLAATYHQFSADVGGAEYGTELDIVATYPVTKNTSVQLKFADYDADELFTDTRKFWLSVNLKF